MAGDALSHLPPKQHVLLVGAGLTAVDAFLALRSQKQIGPIHILSRRGKLPHAHAPYRPLPAPFPIPAKGSARSLLKTIRLAVQAGQAQGVDWRAVIDSLRPVTNEIWQGLAVEEQRRIFRHLKTWWDVHRHRMAPAVGAKVNDALANQHLIVHAGRLQHLTECPSGLQADILLRNGLPLSLRVARVINCTGPDNNYRATENALIRFLLDQGYAVPGATGRGLRTTVHGELVGRNQAPVDWLLTIGPPRFGDLFETIAVPELRKQAEALANRLLSVAREPVEVIPELFIAAGI